MLTRLLYWVGAVFVVFVITFGAVNFEVQPKQEVKAKEITNYVIIEGGQSHYVEEEVNKLIEEGWKPVGGVSQWGPYGNTAQAMVKGD